MAFFQARQKAAIIKYLRWREDKQIQRSVKEQIHFSNIIQKEAASSKKNPSLFTTMELQGPKNRQEDGYHL